MQEIENITLKAFKETFSLGDDIETSELIYNDFPGWDSVGHMALVAALEDSFDCMLDMEDILDMSSYHKCVEIMVKYYEQT